VTGFGDSASIGITKRIRDAAEVDGNIDECSDAYRIGGWGTAVFGFGRLAYAGLAKGYSVAATSGASASAFRSQLRVAFGGGKSLRPPNLGKYGSDSELKRAAGRTNAPFNGYGAAAAASGTATGVACSCKR